MTDAHIRIIVGSRDGEPSSCDLAETVDGEHAWRRGPGESVPAFGMRVLAEAPRPALIIMWPRAQ
jgi:hypothetical protein